ncbi:hypothetical protein [Veillonella agrestimuris]|uniref:hypothetical protein n=1 Tax=Veillonella agrestimuris TaxID=2941340 RepID=UPI002040C095|nr:hypothetical protein [Veillonella agrestimuris]
MSKANSKNQPAILVSVKELESRISKIENIFIKIQAEEDVLLPDYPYSIKFNGLRIVSEWIDTRIKPLLGSIPFKVLDGNGIVPHGNMRMENLRKTYRD